MSSTPMLPKSPPSLQPSQHNHTPAPKHGASPGRRFDHLRESTPNIITVPNSENASRWRELLDRRRSEEDLELVSSDWMKENMPHLDDPWQMDEKSDHEPKGFWLFSPEKRREKLRGARRTLMKNPFVPLLIRLTVLTFSMLALSLAANIYIRADNTNCSHGSSTYLAIIVDTVAIAYTLYVTWDEYHNKPIGLRSARSKMRLIFLDIFFIVFDAANLSLAFEAMSDDRWVCKDNPNKAQNQCQQNDEMCARQKALTATLLIALVAWLVTFSVSIFRIVERVVER